MEITMEQDQDFSIPILGGILGDVLLGAALDRFGPKNSYTHFAGVFFLAQQALLQNGFSEEQRCSDRTKKVKEHPWVKACVYFQPKKLIEPFSFGGKVDREEVSRFLVNLAEASSVGKTTLWRKKKRGREKFFYQYAEILYAILHQSFERIVEESVEYLDSTSGIAGDFDSMD